MWIFRLGLAGGTRLWYLDGLGILLCSDMKAEGRIIRYMVEAWWVGLQDNSGGGGGEGKGRGDFERVGVNILIEFWWSYLVNYVKA